MSTMDYGHPGRQIEEPSMMTGVEGEAAKEAAKVIIEHVVPKITDYGKMLWSGRRFLILGPARSGKTNFTNFLEYLILEPEKATSPTVGVDKRDDKVLRIGPDRSLTLRVRKPRDVAGQAPIQQIQYIKDYIPHCIVVVLDATRFFGVTASDSALDWLRQFCGHLDILLTGNKKVAKKLKSMTVVMNKWDKMAEAAKNQNHDEQEYRQICETYVRDILNGSLHNEFYSEGRPGNINIVVCSLVSGTPFRDSLARQLVQTVALSLAR